MDYANKGNLRENLTSIIERDWKQKLYMLYGIISGLVKIHNQNLIHCDFHDGNILNHNDEKDEENKDIPDLVYISDLGLCRPIKSSLEKDNLYKNLRGNPYILASDIYSFSMIMCIDKLCNLYIVNI